MLLGSLNWKFMCVYMLLCVTSCYINWNWIISHTSGQEGIVIWIIHSLDVIKLTSAYMQIRRKERCWTILKVRRCEHYSFSLKCNQSMWKYFTWLYMHRHSFFHITHNTYSIFLQISLQVVVWVHACACLSVHHCNCQGLCCWWGLSIHAG